MTSAEYQRQYRAKRGARTGQPGRPVSAPCGTASAYKRHRRHGEAPCDACQVAYRDEQARLYRERRDRQHGT